MASADPVHLVMFDIDGTLVDSAGFDGELYARAVATELGIVVDRNWDVYEHVSDSGILAQLLRGSAERDQLAERVRRRFVALVRAYSDAHPAAIREIAGAKRLLERLCAAAGVRVAVATGGWEETAKLKLAHVGIDASKLAFASSSVTISSRSAVPCRITPLSPICKIPTRSSRTSRFRPPQE